MYYNIIWSNYNINFIYMYMYMYMNSTNMVDTAVPLTWLTLTRDVCK